MRDYDNEAKQCYETRSQLNFLDEQIESGKSSIKRLEDQLRVEKAYLKELERVRKMVTPEDEGKLKAFRSVGLI